MSKPERFLCDHGAFRDMYLGRLYAAAGEQFKDDGLDDQVLAAYAEWRGDVERLMEDLSPLLSVSAKNDSMIRTAALKVMEMNFTVMDLAADVCPQIETMCTEFSSRISSLGASGVLEYPDIPGFVLYGDGSEYTTDLMLDYISEPLATVAVDERASTHCTSPFVKDIASYTTCWRIDLDDVLRFTVTGHDSVSSRSGASSAYSSVAEINEEFTVSAASGWALMGVDYTPTDSLGDVLLTAAMKVLLKFLDPMMDLLKSLQDVL